MRRKDESSVANVGHFRAISSAKVAQAHRLTRDRASDYQLNSTVAMEPTSTAAMEGHRILSVETKYYTNELLSERASSVLSRNGASFFFTHTGRYVVLEEETSHGCLALLFFLPFGGAAERRKCGRHPRTNGHSRRRERLTQSLCHRGRYFGTTSAAGSR